MQYLYTENHKPSTMEVKEDKQMERNKIHGFKDSKLLRYYFFQIYLWIQYSFNNKLSRILSKT